MIKTPGLLVATVMSMVLFCAPSGASNFNYTNFEIGFTSNPSSISGKSQFAFGENTHFIINAASQFGGDWVAAVGAGFHAPINEFVDIYGDAKLYSVKLKDEEKHNFGDIAYGVNVGLRTWILPQFEANLLIGQIAFNSDDTRSVVEIGGRFHNTDALSIGGTYNANGLFKGQFYFNVRFEY